MSRPETFDDVPSFLREPRTFVIFESQLMAAYPDIGTALLQVLTLAKNNSGITICIGDTGYTKISVDFTDDEKAEILSDRQDLWDRCHTAYYDESSRDTVSTYTLNSWVLAEGLPPVDQGGES